MTSSKVELATVLRAGAATVTITPDPSTSLQGYGVRLAEGIDEPLFASALAIGGDEVQWLLISLDVIGIDRAFTSRIRNGLMKRLSLPRHAITLACSHTHSGPPTLAQLGPVAADHEYLGLLETRVLEAAEAAVAGRRPVTLRTGEAVIGENVNRRERRNGRIEIGTDNEKPVDHRVWIARLDASGEAAANAPMALIVQYACHATCSAEVPRVNSDWPGAMSKALQRLYDSGGASPVVCFIQGCAGDVTHRIGRDPQSWPNHLGAGSSLEASIMGRLVAAGAMSAIERATPARADGVFVASTPVALPFRDGSPSEQTEIQVVRIGQSPVSVVSPTVPSIWLLFLPGEPLAAYGDALSRTFEIRFGALPRNVVVCGYANDAVGYLCTPQALHEGGYEAADAHRVYHRPAPFADGTLSIIQRTCTAAATRLYQPRSWWQSAAGTMRSIVRSRALFLAR